MTQPRDRERQDALTRRVREEKEKRNAYVRTCPFCGRGHHLCDVPVVGKDARMATGKQKNWEGLGE